MMLSTIRALTSLVVLVATVGATIALPATAEADYYGCFVGAMPNPPTAWIGKSHYASSGTYSGGAYASLLQNYHAYPYMGSSRTFVQVADDSPNVYMKTGVDHHGGPNIVFREFVTADEPWVHFETLGAVNGNAYEYFTVQYDRYGINPRGKTTTYYHGQVWGATRSLYPGVLYVSQALGETITDADQMAGDTVVPFSFVDVRRYSVLDGQSIGSWVAIGGSSVNSKPYLYGLEVINSSRFDIWDYRCPQ